MIKLFLLQALLVVAVFLVCPKHSFADIAPLRLAPIGGIIAPSTSHNDIRLDSQEVIIRLKENFYIVDAVFQLFNTGDTTTEWVGFPEFGYISSAFSKFDMWVDGRKIKTAKERDEIKEMKSIPGKMDQDHRWRVGRVTFPGNRKITIRVIYETVYRPVRRTLPRIQYVPLKAKLKRKHSIGFAAYLYGTGSYWKGSIRKASFMVDGNEIGGTETFYVLAMPPHQTIKWSKHVTSNTVKLIVKDIEPNPGNWLYIRIFTPDKRNPRE